MILVFLLEEVSLGSFYSAVLAALSLSFESLIMMGLGVDIFEFTLFEVFEHLLSYCC